MDSVQFDLDDLASIQLNDAFIERNIDKPLDENISRQTLKAVCDAFVREFLFRRGDTISGLLESQNASSKILEDVEQVLKVFIDRLSSIKADIEDVRKSLATTSVELRNTRSAEKILWDTVSQFVVPPELVQVITQSSEQQLGTQFQLCVRQLLNYLNYRKSVWRMTEAEKDAPLAREIRLSLGESQSYAEIAGIIDGLTLYACIKIKAFLSQKLGLLTVSNTNFCIQQEHSLKQYAFYVHFLRSAVPLLKHIYNQNALFPYRVVRALYTEFRKEYCVITSELYLRKMQEYVVLCNTMEYSTAGDAAGASSVAGSLFGGVSGSTDRQQSGVRYVLPDITDTKNGVSFLSYRLGERAAIFGHIFGQPLIPTIEKASGKKHHYEETFRSMLSLLHDVVTHEYIFTFHFFSGDMTVYVEVFKPVIQFIVDYVSEVVLTQSSGAVKSLLNQTPHASVNVNGKNDCYGLLILIRLCFEFRSSMHYDRKLTCLDGFFDSLLLQLWPAFKKTFERQLVSLRCATPQMFLPSFTHLGGLREKLSFVHPVVKCFTEFSSVVLSIVYGGLRADRRRAHAASTVEHSAYRTAKADDADSVGSQDVDDYDESRGTDDAAENERKGEGEGDVVSQALAIIQKEKEDDTVDTSSQFTALCGNIAFMRIEMIHLLEGISRALIAEETNEASRALLGPLKDAFLLNNLFCMMQAPKLFPIFGEGEGDGSPTLGAHEEEFAALKEVYDTKRITFVAAVLDQCIPSFCRVVHNPNSHAPEQVIHAAEQFALRWKTQLSSMKELVSSLIADSAHAREIVAQVCMQCLLFNTRFHNAVAQVFETHKELFKGRPLKSLLVTNQNLLQHMRTFAVIAEEEMD